jgi:signal peptide peptidase SppA
MKKIEEVKYEKQSSTNQNVDFKEDMKSKNFPKIKEIKIISENNRFNGFSIKNLILFTLSLFIISNIISNISFSLASKTAVIEINSQILTEDVGGLNNYISSKFIVSQLEEIGKDNTYKAIILDINSPGGSPVASNEISTMLETLKNENNISVFTYIRDGSFSGAYWIAASSSKIYANDLSLIGSLGVTSSSLGFENFIKNYNITYRKYIAGKYKDFLSPFRKPEKEELKILANILKSVYNKFIKHISVNRNLTIEQVGNLATGEIFTSDIALKNGLIDEISSYQKMKKDLEKIVGKTTFVNIEKEATFFESLGLTNINFNINTNSNLNKIELK